MDKTCDTPIKDIKKISIVTIFLSLFLSIGYSGNLFAQSPATQDNYREKALGTKAFDNGLYSVAMNYYKRYLKDAEGNSPAMRDAYFNLIATCLRTNNINQADKLYNEVSQKNKQFFANHSNGQRELKFWEAEILLKKEKFNEAETVFNKIISASTANKPDTITLNSIAGLGISQFRQDNFKKAYQTFEALERQSAQTNPDLNDLAIKQLIIINLLNKNFSEAKNIISKNSENTVQLKLLSIFIMIDNGNLQEAQNKYDGLKPQANLNPDPLWFIVAYTFSNTYLKQNAYSKALPLLHDAYKLAPDLYDKEITTILTINTQLNLSHYDKAIKSATAFMETFPDSPRKEQVLLTLLEVLAREKQYTPIEKLASKYFNININKNDTEIKLANVIGKAFICLKKYDEADKYFDYIIEYSKNKEDNGNAKYWKTEILFLKKQYDDALAELEDIQKEYPSCLENVLYKKGQIYFIQGHYNKSAKTLKQLLTFNPGTEIQPSPVLLYAIVLNKAGDLQNSVDQFMDFISKNPDSDKAPEACYEAGSIFLLLNKTNMAVHYFNKIVNTYNNSPLFPKACYKLVYANLINNNLTEALKHSDLLVNKYPKSDFTIQTLFWITDYYRNSEQFDKALDELSLIASKYNNNPQVLAHAFYNEGYILYLANKNDQAIETLKKLETIKTKSNFICKSWFLQGDILSSEGNYTEAIKNYEQALTKSTDENDIKIAALGRIGDCYFATINFTADSKKAINQAINYYNKILDLENISDFIKSQTLYKLGKCYELLKNNKKAISMLHEAFYSNTINMEHGKPPVNKWFVKSGTALVRLLQAENTPEAAKAAIDVLYQLIKYGAKPSQVFKSRINEIKQTYRL